MNLTVQLDAKATSSSIGSQLPVVRESIYTFFFATCPACLARAMFESRRGPPLIGPALPLILLGAGGEGRAWGPHLNSNTCSKNIRGTQGARRRSI